jgi:hypothetical protein
MPGVEDNIKKDLYNEIRLVLDITARIDERVKLFIEKQSEMTHRLNGFVDSHNSLTNRVTVIETENVTILHDVKIKTDFICKRLLRLEAKLTNLNIEKIEKNFNEYSKTLSLIRGELSSVENRVHKMEDRNIGLWSKMKFFMDLVAKGIWVLIVCWLLYKFGLNSPPIP